MTATILTPADYQRIARSLTQSFEKSDPTQGLAKITVEYRDDIDGLKDGLVFLGSQGKVMSKAELAIAVQQRDEQLSLEEKAYSKYPQLLEKAKGQRAWLKSFSQFVIEDSTNFLYNNYDAAVISEGTISKAPFAGLLANGARMEKLQPINWNLEVGKVDGLVKALNNIARMEGAKDVHFQREAKTGRVTYYSDTLSKDELSKKVTSIIEHIVATDKNLATNGTLNADGKEIANKMNAFKSDRYYVAFEKETGFAPGRLVDIVENAQIAMAARRYTSAKNVKVDNKDPYEKQLADKVVRTEDGKDTYSYINGNLEQKYIYQKTPHLLFPVGPIHSLVTRKLGYVQDGDAPVPNLTKQDNITTNRVTAQGEAEMIAELNTMRGTMPVEFSADPLPLPTPPPVKNKKANHVKH